MKRHFMRKLLRIGVALCWGAGLAGAGLAQTVAKLDKVVVAGWSKPITEITNLLVEEDKGFFKARGIDLGYVSGAGGDDEWFSHKKKGLKYQKLP